MDKASLGDRMKGYEGVSQSVLMKRTPVIIRVDGKAFHTFTKQFCKDGDPFSQTMQTSMVNVAAYLTHNIQGAVVSYTQSDEVSVLLKDWNAFETQQWYGGKIQKIASVSAAMASTAFYASYEYLEGPIEKYVHRPLFDSRVFNVPFDDVVNYFVWRQKDAMRNSVNMLGQHYFSPNQLHGKKVDDVKYMLKNVSPWEELTIAHQRGICVEKTSFISPVSSSIDEEIPIFTEDRMYIRKWLGDYDGEV